MTKLNREQLDKLKRTWAIKKDFDLLGTMGVEEYVDELREWMADIEFMDDVKEMRKLFGTHAPQLCYRSIKGHNGETLKRIPVEDGWLYMRTVWMAGVVSSSMQFVPRMNVEITSDGAHPLPEGEVF
jgi:hypothetical protein